MRLTSTRRLPARTYIQSAFGLLFGFEVFELIVAELGQLVVSLGRADTILVHSTRDLGRVVKCLVGSGREEDKQHTRLVFTVLTNDLGQCINDGPSCKLSLEAVGLGQLGICLALALVLALALASLTVAELEHLVHTVGLPYTAPLDVSMSCVCACVRACAHLHAFEHLDGMLQRQVGELLVEPSHENVVSTRTLGIIVNGLFVLLAQHESECLDELVHAFLGAAPQRRSAQTNVGWSMS